MAEPEVRFLAVNPVAADRTADFESFLRTVVHPAVVEHRPQHIGRWHVMRSVEAWDGVVPYCFLFDGGEAQEWRLDTLLELALGAAEAEQAMDELGGMLVGEQQFLALAPVVLTEQVEDPQPAP